MSKLHNLCILLFPSSRKEFQALSGISELFEEFRVSLRASSGISELFAEFRVSLRLCGVSSFPMRLSEYPF